MSILIASFTAIGVSPIDFLLDTNGTVFIGMFVVLVGLALPVIAVRAAGRRGHTRLNRQRRFSPNNEEVRIFPDQTSPERRTAEGGFAILRPDQYGIDQESTIVATDEIFRLGAVHRIRSGERE